MTSHSPPSALDRIERALARIEATARCRREASKGLVTRHAALRARISDAIGSIDELIEGRAPDIGR